MKKLFKNQNESINSLNEKMNISRMKLYRYANGECKIDNMPCELLLKLSKHFNVEPFTLYKNMKEYEREKNEKNK